MDAGRHAARLLHVELARGGRPVRRQTPPVPDLPEVDGQAGASLAPGIPNPLTHQTSIHYSLPSESEARLTIHHVLGRRVKHSRPVLASGPAPCAVGWNRFGGAAGGLGRVLRPAERWRRGADEKDRDATLTGRFAPHHPAPGPGRTCALRTTKQNAHVAWGSTRPWLARRTRQSLT